MIFPEIVYEDAHIAVVLKPAGIATHPGSGISSGTLVDFLREHFSSLSELGGMDRPGIIHRLDKDTSGLLLIAKTDVAYRFLIDAMKHHTIRKCYQVLVAGHLAPKSGTIEAPVARSPTDRKKMTAFSATGRPSVTHYRVLQYFLDSTLLEVELETGRTHQIRVHMKAIGFPVVGDCTYGRRHLNKKFEQQFGLRRQFLHAYSIQFPLLDGSRKKIEAPFPSDLQAVLDGLNQKS